jgi:hypothetical protein
VNPTAAPAFNRQEDVARLLFVDHIVAVENALIRRSMKSPDAQIAR